MRTHRLGSEGRLRRCRMARLTLPAAMLVEITSSTPARLDLRFGISADGIPEAARGHLTRNEPELYHPHAQRSTHPCP